jgi:hypothetical protein
LGLHINKQTTKGNKMLRKTGIRSSSSIRFAGLAAMAAGVIFAGIQPFHPPDVLSSVTTGAWTIVISLKLIMCILFLVGTAGLYARQATSVGWLGLLGLVLLSMSWWLQTGFVFAELLILPVLATSTPEFVESYLGVVNGHPGQLQIGALVPIYAMLGGCYLLGGLAFGIATVQARILPRSPALLLVVAAAATPAAALLPHEIQRLAAIPMGAAFAWLGYALLCERRSHPVKVADSDHYHLI